MVNYLKSTKKLEKFVLKTEQADLGLFLTDNQVPDMAKSSEAALVSVFLSTWVQMLSQEHL